MSLTIEERNRIVEQLADLVERKGVAAPALLFLEANKPLSFIAGQALLMLQPFFNLFFDSRLSSDLTALLDDRSNVELLIGRLERGRG